MKRLIALMMLFALSSSQAHTEEESMQEKINKTVYRTAGAIGAGLSYIKLCKALPIKDQFQKLGLKQLSLQSPKPYDGYMKRGLAGFASGYLFKTSIQAFTLNPKVPLKIGLFRIVLTMKQGL